VELGFTGRKRIAEHLNETIILQIYKILVGGETHMKTKIIGIFIGIFLVIPMISFTVIANDPPTIPTIRGPEEGKAGELYRYYFLSADPDQDLLYYIIDWGAGSDRSFIGKFAPGLEPSREHTWTQGTYTIRAKALDDHGAESDWGTFEITMPRITPIHRFLLRLFDQFPQLAQFFNNLLYIQ